MASIRRSSSFGLSPKKRQSLAALAAGSTPTSRRQSLSTALNTNSPAALLIDGSANNDEVERRERQLNRLHQLKAKGVPSPTATPTDRRKSINAFTGLTNQQIADHYAKCIQLSTENKINIKNAFNLQLIDCMSELLKKKDSDMNNFQVASCTLDASTKIYGYRVDSVHADTLKMAGGLGRTKDKAGTDEANLEGENGVSKGKRKVKAKKCVFVESNIKNLNVAHFDLEFDVDPLFKKMASQFSDGSSSGSQFLNTLHLLDDGCQLIIDSETIVWEVSGANTSSEAGVTTIPPGPDYSELVICPTFAPFEFTSWSVSDEDQFTEMSKTRKESEDEHAFDINAVPEPLDLDTDGFPDMPDDGDPTDETVITLGGGACRQGPFPPPPQFEIVHLKDHLANAPLEYSYFDSKVMSAWAGPGHWKLKSFNKALTASKQDGKPKERLKKEFVIDYSTTPEIDQHFAVLRQATKLTQTTIKRWSEHATTLPVDLHYDPAKFNSLYLRPEIVIRRQDTEKCAEVDDSVLEYKYDNENDKENYCPPDVDEDHSGMAYDVTDMFSQTVLPSQPSVLEEQGENRNQDFLGNNLVEAPNKVNLINIGYARTAKKIDMKKLKSIMWNILSVSDTNKENESTNTYVRETLQASHKEPFSKLYVDLKPRLPSKMSENLSVPLAFIALLHLANEHSLKLTSLEELGDFIVSQD